MTIDNPGCYELVRTVFSNIRVKSDSVMVECTNYHLRNHWWCFIPNVLELGFNDKWLGFHDDWLSRPVMC